MHGLNAGRLTRPVNASGDRTIENRATYDRIASAYLAHQLQVRATGDDPFQPLERRWTELLPIGSLLGDLGCGPAVDGARFAAAGYRVVGLDLSRGMLVAGAPRMPGLLAQADLRALPVRAGALDGVWCSAALLHVPEPGTERVLEEIRAVLRPGGALALITALGDGTCLEPVPYAPEERRWFVYRQRPRFERQIEQAGFRLLDASQVDGHRIWLTTLARAI